MKKILIPTDFSDVADNATNYAIELATEFKSELYLYHVYTFDRFNYDLNFNRDKQPYAEKMDRIMDRTKQKFLEKITQKKLSIQTFVEQDIIFSLFREKVDKHRINMIVMGSKGASGLSKVIFGSVAATALEMAKVPVLVIPPNYSFSPIKHIVLAMDYKEVSSSVLLPLQKLAFKFGAKVTVLNVNVGSDKKAYRKTDLCLEGVETIYRKMPLSKTINESINEFIEKKVCNLLCMIRREKGFFESFFNKSITRAQVFNSQVPLLVLPEKKINS